MPSQQLSQPRTQHIINSIQEWNTQDLIALAELKIQLRIPDTDTSKDEELNLIIDGVSAQMAKMANRVFGYAEVNEVFFNNVEEDRLYFSRWPVVFDDIELMELDGVDILSGHGNDWVLESKTGMLFRPFDPWTGTLNVNYKGGYKLPDEAPDDLARAATVAAREDYYAFVRGATLTGVRMISHKSARVMYYPPGQVAATQGGGGPNLGPTWNAVQSILNKYIRHWL